MARFVVAMNVSLDGYVDHDGFAPGPLLFRHWTEQVETASGAIYGRRMYEIMRYWDEDRPEWTAAEHRFAAVWRRQQKWVMSGSLGSVGPNATLVSADTGAVARRLRSERDGEIDICGTILAQRLAALGLIDEYRLYFHPVVLGKGTPFFQGPRPPLRLTESRQMDEGVIRLAYVPA